MKTMLICWFRVHMASFEKFSVNVIVDVLWVMDVKSNLHEALLSVADPHKVSLLLHTWDFAMAIAIKQHLRNL